MNSTPAPARRLRSQRGSLLIVAMLLCAVIGISLASYIRLGVASQKISNRALYNNAAMNLAENGMEEAMYAINQMVADPSYNWPAWSHDSTNAWRKWTSFTFDQNASGVSRVYVQHYDGALAPTIVARSTVTLGGATSAPIEKWIKVTLAMTSKFANGLVAKNTISFSGNNATVDSWNSDPDNNPATAAIPYSSAVKNDNGSVGSILVTSAISVNNADIFGYVATGGTPATIGPNGLVGPFGTTSGTIAPGHSSTDFAASFDPVAAPTGGSSIAAIANGDLPTTIGTSGTTNTYRLTSISGTGNSSKVLTIQGDVTLILTGATAISMGGQSSISIAPGAKLKIYTDGNIAIGGNGIMNGGTTDATANQPINLQIWGTRTTGTQDISVAGNGVFSGIVYAPQGNVTINGNGSVSGSVVANSISVTGNAQFHYDESLGNFGGNPYRVAAWKEMTTSTERATWEPLLNF